MAGPCGRIRIMTVHDIHFSARGTTASYARAVCTAIGLPTISSNWLRREERREVDISHDDLLVFSMPVYGGFIPALCRDSAVLLQGHDTPAIIVAVYGNRHYDDALVQMRGLLEERGFTVVAGAAFVARHSIFPSVAADRPDDDDLDEARSFAKGLWSPSAGRGALRFQAGRTMTALSSRAPRSTPVAMTGASGAWPVPASVPQEPSTGPTRA